MRRLRKPLIKRVLLGAVSLAIVVATFVYFLPTIANYGEVWGVVKDLSWQRILVLLGATALNLVTFAPPWMVALPGLAFLQALTVTQASTALSIVVPGGIAAGVAGSYGILRAWGFAGRDVARAITLTGLWNQFLNLTFPIVAVFLLAITGESTAALATIAFVGVAILGVVVSGFVLILLSSRLAEDIGNVAARFASWGLAKIRRGPVSWNGASFERFRLEAGDLLERRWHLLTLTSLAGQLTVFLLLLVSLRALDVPASEVNLVEAFAAWSVARLVGSVPITPGGIGVVELALTGTLVGFGGNNAGVVASVLVYRFLTAVPTLLLGLGAAFTFRRRMPPAAAVSPGQGDAAPAPGVEG
ncbi:MAG: YbhN family protein [Gaiellaceae bacterium]